MKLSAAKLRLLEGIDACRGGLPVGFLKPATRALVSGLRKDGIISKRHREFLTLTQAGRTALSNSKGE